VRSTLHNTPFIHDQDLIGFEDAPLLAKKRPSPSTTDVSAPARTDPLVEKREGQEPKW
jgi:hypothetical protein